MCLVERGFEDFRSFGASWQDAKRKRRMVKGEDQRFIQRRVFQFMREPILLFIAYRAAFRDVGVQADDGRQACLQGPVSVGLGHCMAACAISLRSMDRGRCGEICHERRKRRIMLEIFAVVVAWYGKNGCRIMAVWSVELIVIFLLFAVVINQVSQ